MWRSRIGPWWALALCLGACRSDAAPRNPREPLPWRDLPAAEEEVRRGLAEDPDDARLWAAYAGLASRRREWDDCLDRCDRALALRSGLREALLYRGAARLATGDAEGAETDLRRAAEGAAGAPPARAAERLLAIAEARHAGPSLRDAVAYAGSRCVVITDLGADHARRVAGMVEELHAELERALPAPARGPGDPLSVTSFARREDFARYAGALLDDDEMPEMALGVYVAPTRDLLLVGGGDPERLRRVLRHEATHAYVDGFVAEPPPWLSEGLADAFAAGGEHPERSEGLRRAAEGCDGRRLRSLLAADGAEFLGVEEAELADRARAAGDNYALAFALVDLLRARHGARLRAAWETLVEGRSAETVAEAAVGARDTEALAAEVREHAARLLRAAGR